MSKLQELYACQFGLITEKAHLPRYALGKLLYNFARADEQNLNYRIYTEKLLLREITKKSEELKKEKIAGQLDHPLEGITRLSKAAHILNSVSYDPKTKLASATSFILATTGGKDFKVLLDSGIKMGASMRGFGTVGQDKKVNDDWNLQSIDFVLKPSFAPDAVISKDNLIESVDSLEEKSPPPEELIKFVLDGVYSQRNEIGHEESYEEFLAEQGAAIKASVLVKYGVYENIETALIEMGEENVLRKMKAEEETKVYTSSDCYVEARLMGISPNEMAKKLNLAEERKKVDRGSDFSLKEAQALIEEAQAAGVNLSDPKKRAEFLEKMSEMPTHSEPSLHERAIAIQERLKAKGTEATLETIQRVLIFDDKEAEIKKKQKRIGEMVEREISQSGATPSREERKRLINRSLRKENLPILTEEE